MKKLFLLILIASFSSSLVANINGNGYYRVKNYGSSRWASLVDNQGSVDKYSSSADLHALALTSDTEYILTDPGSIVYITNISGSQYDVAAQGVSLESLVDNPIKIIAAGNADNQSLYRIYGTYKNAAAYIGDGNTNLSGPTGKASIYENEGVTDSNVKFVEWMIIPVDVKGDNYFAAQPDLTAGKNSYTTLFTSFAYKPYSKNVKAYYIGRVGFGMVEMIEITGAVPPGSPVIIQCAGNSPSDNKLEIVDSQEVLPENSLTGVYFDYEDVNAKNYVTYNPSTMRVLGLCEDGSLGFVTSSDLKHVPANSAYLSVPAGASPEFKCVTTAEFETNLPEAPEQIYFGDGNVLLPQDDYTYEGTFSIPAQENNLFSINFYTEGSDPNIIGAVSDNGGDVNVKVNSGSSFPFEYGSEASWVIQDWYGGNILIRLNLQYQFVTFSSSASVDSLVNEKSDFIYQGKKLIASGDQEIKVFDLSGRTIVSGFGTVDVSGIPKGIYIATCGNNSIKIAL